MKKQVYIADSISAAISALFLYTALSKLRDVDAFKTTLSQSDLFKPFTGLIASLLPFVEIGIAIYLFFPSSRKKGLLAAAALLTSFTIYLLAIMVHSPVLPCTCGGVINSLSWKQHLLLNLLFMLLALLGAMLYKKHSEAMKPTPP